ncbi:PREDICTED: maestro heat-like repeat family member 5 [Ceratotherium simum simum]|uniref:Maestro heat-like repeat family member 5 n=1 Tax=Ceratotherium simum simum TaxID=73337 RepID=A0ABM1CVC3_CERSS|nr:PREDICTED: maestro heat-like repeat family member 5 [Ceratotherium simum simum]
MTHPWQAQGPTGPESSSPAEAAAGALGARRMTTGLKAAAERLLLCLAPPLPSPPAGCCAAGEVQGRLSAPVATVAGAGVGCPGPVLLQPKNPCPLRGHPLLPELSASLGLRPQPLPLPGGPKPSPRRSGSLCSWGLHGPSASPAVAQARTPTSPSTNTPVLASRSCVRGRGPGSSSATGLSPQRCLQAQGDFSGSGAPGAQARLDPHWEGTLASPGCGIINVVSLILSFLICKRANHPRVGSTLHLRPFNWLTQAPQILSDDLPYLESADYELNHTYGDLLGDAESQRGDQGVRVREIPSGVGDEGVERADAEQEETEGERRGVVGTELGELLPSRPGRQGSAQYGNSAPQPRFHHPSLWSKESEGDPPVSAVRSSEAQDPESRTIARFPPERLDTRQEPTNLEWMTMAFASSMKRVLGTSLQKGVQPPEKTVSSKFVNSPQLKPMAGVQREGAKREVEQAGHLGSVPARPIKALAKILCPVCTAPCAWLPLVVARARAVDTQDLSSPEAPLSVAVTPSDGFHHPRWRSNCLSSTEGQEVDTDHPGRVIVGEHPSDSPPWEEALVSEIRAMSALEQSLALEAVRHCIQEHSQLLRKEVSDTSIQELLASLKLDLKQPLEKTFLFHFYGLILRECASANLLKEHLASLLELSHQSSGQREGIALAVGITSASHMEEVWAMLEHLGRTRFLRTTFMSSDSQELDPNMHWRWVSSTSLLCYGQMATHAREQILPWVDNIASRMVYYFSCSTYDNILKTSFLSAAIMLMKALQRENGAQSYKFTQISELIQCLLRILQNEPNFLATLLRQKVILVIVGLSNLRPSLTPMVKSRILQTCLQSLYALPPMETLKRKLPPLERAPDVMMLYQKSMQALDLLFQNFVSENKSMDEICFLLQHTEPWLKSDKSHERKRVVQTIFLLLKYVVDYVKLTEEAVPSMLGHQIGLLTLLWRDKDNVTQSHSHQCVYLLLQLLIQQKGSMAEFMHLNKMKNSEARAYRESEMKFYNLVKALDENLTVAQHTQLVLTLLQGLCSHSHLCCDLAAQLVLMIFEDHSIKPEQVAEILQGLFQKLPCIIFKNILQTMMKAVTVLGAQHTQETVEVLLSLCRPSERQVTPLWTALATNNRLARKVVTLLYMKLKLRPPKELIRLPQQAELISLLVSSTAPAPGPHPGPRGNGIVIQGPRGALGTIYELLYLREYKPTVRWAFAGLLLGLLTQLHYLFELDVAEGVSDYQEDILEARPLNPCRICLEALKGLFWTTNYWEVFADLKLLRGWELLEHLETYTEGVTLLARAMAHYDCEVKAVLGQAVISLQSSEERDNIVAILIITEFLNSQELTQYTSRKTMDNFLNLGLNNPNQLVRAMSLKGLSSILMHPKKVLLLRNRLIGLLDSFLKPEPGDLIGLMEILGDIVHCLGGQGVGTVSLKIAQHLLPLFEHVSGRAPQDPRLGSSSPKPASQSSRSCYPHHSQQQKLLPTGLVGQVRKEGSEQEDVRGGAIFLYGNVLYSGGRKFRPALRTHAFQALVPLLLHLADPCPRVVTKTKFTFLRCAILLKWEFRKELFCKLAWGHGLGAENDIFIYMVESNFGNYHQFLMQALIYLGSPHQSLKLTAMKFIGGLLQDYFADLCSYLKKGDVKILLKHFEMLKQDQDSLSRKFYRSFSGDIIALSQYVTH